MNWDVKNINANNLSMFFDIAFVLSLVVLVIGVFSGAWDFTFLLTFATVITGAIAAADKYVFEPRRKQFEQPTKLPMYIDFSRSFFPVILIVLILRSFVVEPFRIPSGSMMPTLQDGDFILVNKFSYGLRMPVLNWELLDFGDPERGDVAVFRYPENPTIAYIKRIVGLPGDNIEYRNKELFVNGKKVPRYQLESDVPGYTVYLEKLGDTEHTMQLNNFDPANMMVQRYKVPPGHYFVMGDNRDNSSDSRIWGYLPDENMIGKAFFIWMNWNCLTFNGHCSRIGTIIE